MEEDDPVAADARRRCDPDTHQHPGPGRDYPCWSCRLDAYFAHALTEETP